MFLLQAQVGFEFSPLYVGTTVMAVLTILFIFFVILHQRRVIKLQSQMRQIEEMQQKNLLNASIRMQEEERQRIAADLHDDAGPLLATARLYLNENLVNMDKAGQLQAIMNSKQIIDESIQLIRNISHNMMPPTLKNFGLESAVSDFFNKINGSGKLNVSSRFHDYKIRLESEKEMIAFRVIQELVNNILKHSGSSFIHMTQHNNASVVLLRLHHDGHGLTHEEFLRLTHTGNGLGLKNITSRLKVIDGKIMFEHDLAQSYYKVTIEIPREEENKM
jgi:two-component system, NarL family, sensor kinase